MEDENVEILNKIHKGIVMGMESISVIEPKVGDRNFRDDLNYQYNEYGKILDKINSTAETSNIQLEDTTTGEKVMGWATLQMNTIMDKSNSQISEILIRGNTMGIIEGRKLLNQNPDATQEVKNILNEFVKIQENNIEKLKTYL
ncbi:MAG: hypothetical protein IJ223_02880 [Clostridia bacterium]|nr:hypothetical protein [Clostridia bacterium]